MHAHTVDVETLGRWLADAGLRLTGRHRFVYRGRQHELVELMEIPAMIDPLTPDLDPDERRAVVREAGRRTDGDEAVEVPWVYFDVEA
jgi:hypothetical protein